MTIEKCFMMQKPKYMVHSLIILYNAPKKFKQPLTQFYFLKSYNFYEIYEKGQVFSTEPVIKKGADYCIACNR